MVDRIAGESEKDAIEEIDESIDQILSALEVIGEAAGRADVDDSEEKDALKVVMDTVETAIAPYMVDVVNAMEVFVGKEEG